MDCLWRVSKMQPIHNIVAKDKSIFFIRIKQLLAVSGFQFYSQQNDMGH